MKKLLLLIAIALSLIYIVHYLTSKRSFNEPQHARKTILKETDIVYKMSNRPELINYLNEKVPQRDFLQYTCKNQQRIGGPSQHVKNAPTDLFRIDGAWVLCFDDGIEPTPNSCNILSFGINADDSFDDLLNVEYGCNVYSFDPYSEPSRITELRQKNNLKDSYQVKINDKWTFFSQGISHLNSNKDSFNKKGSMLSLNNIVVNLELENKVIDCIKMDIEGGEFDIINNMDMDYMCKYVKQFVMETHPASAANTNISPVMNLVENYKILLKLEKCFSLFYRHSRFFMKNEYAATGHLTEWQQNDAYRLDIKQFKNSTNLALFMYLYGELSFLNENFFN